MSQSVKYVGLDVHRDTISVAVAEDGKRSEVREHGEISNTPAALTKLLGKLGGSGVALHVCYEAGPCGYGIQRQVTAAGHDYAVVAPSLIPRRPGDRSVDRDLRINRSSRIEGIGRPKVELSFQPDVIPRMIRVPDVASVATIQWLDRLIGR